MPHQKLPPRVGVLQGYQIPSVLSSMIFPPNVSFPLRLDRMGRKIVIGRSDPPLGFFSPLYHFWPLQSVVPSWSLLVFFFFD